MMAFSKLLISLKQLFKSNNDKYEYDFLPDVLAVMETPPSRASRALLWVIISFFAIALIWAFLAEMDVVATAPGKLDPVGSVKVVQALETSKIKYLNVIEGQLVAKGDRLVELDPTDPETDRRQAELEYSLAKALSFRYSSLINLLDHDQFLDQAAFVEECSALSQRNHCSEQALVFEKEKLAYLKKIELLNHEINSQESVVRSAVTDLDSKRQILALSKENYNSEKKLFTIGSISQNDWLVSKRNYLEDQSQYYNANSRLDEAKAQLQTVDNQLEDFVSNKLYEYHQSVEETESKTKSLKLSIIKAKEREENRYLKSPVDGVVSQLKINTVGGVVTPADVLMIIVPNDSQLQATVSLKNMDVGFVSQDMTVNIKVDSFQYTKYGSIEGSVSTISADAVMDDALGWVYPVKIKLNEQKIKVGDKYVPLSAGMTVVADLNIGKRPVIEYFLTNFVEYVDESFQER